MLSLILMINCWENPSIELTNKKFDWSQPLHDLATEISNLAAKMKSMGIDISESFLVQFILNSLPAEFGQFQKINLSLSIPANCAINDHFYIYFVYVNYQIMPSPTQPDTESITTINHTLLIPHEILCHDDEVTMVL
ncbi:hypothetical protein CR513_57182, partial [Mucuna pruriens]